MTTTIKRGAGRPAAAAKTTKAAQRTPLPASSTRKPATGKAPAKAAPAPGNTATRAESHPERRAGSGPAKLARLTAALEPFGWKVSSKTGPGGRIEAQAKRGAETLRLVWVDGAYDYGLSKLTDGGKIERKVRNLSEAIRLCAVKLAK